MIYYCDRISQKEQLLLKPMLLVQKMIEKLGDYTLLLEFQSDMLFSVCFSENGGAFLWEFVCF